MTPLLFLAAAACAPPFHALISEILYDAAGDDTGREFVELFNPGPIALPLAGARLEAGDGSGPGRWSLRWTAGERDSIASSSAARSWIRYRTRSRRSSSRTGPTRCAWHGRTARPRWWAMAPRNSPSTPADLLRPMCRPASPWRAFPTRRTWEATPSTSAPPHRRPAAPTSRVATWLWSQARSGSIPSARRVIGPRGSQARSGTAEARASPPARSRSTASRQECPPRCSRSPSTARSPQATPPASASRCLRSPRAATSCASWRASPVTKRPRTTPTRWWFVSGRGRSG